MARPRPCWESSKLASGAMENPAPQRSTTRASETASAPATGEGARVALAHDYLLVMRGAERTFAAMCDTTPTRRS